MSTVKKATPKKSVVKTEKATNVKTEKAAKKSAPVSIAVKDRKQTAEGWKRMMLKS